MRYLKCFFMAMMPIFLLSIGSFSIAYQPSADETVTKISNLSDAFVYGTILDINYSNTNGRPITINKLEVKDIYFDKTGRVRIKEEINVVTEGGFFTDESGKKIRVKELNSPELVKNLT